MQELRTEGPRAFSTASPSVSTATRGESERLGLGVIRFCCTLVYLCSLAHHSPAATTHRGGLLLTVTSLVLACSAASLPKALRWRCKSKPLQASEQRQCKPEENRNSGGADLRTPLQPQSRSSQQKLF